MAIYTKTPNGWEAIAQDAKAVSSFGSIVPDGNQTDEGTYIDADGREWVWYEWATAGDYSVTLSGGLYRVLCVGGGDAGSGSADVHQSQGQPGLVNEGLWEFQAGTHTVTVGDRGNKNTTAKNGDPSSIGDYGNQGSVAFGSANWGRGNTGTSETGEGYVSSITGEELQYATGYMGEDRPGRGGLDSGENRVGCVIIATVVNGGKRSLSLRH